MDRSLISLWSIPISLASLIIAITLSIINRRRENYQNFHQQVASFASLEIFLATQRLWTLYRENPGTAFLDKYFEIMEKELRKANTLPYSKRMDFERHTLHFQRKQVLQFWKGLALLMKYNLVPHKAAYKWWQKDDIDIVPKVILPIENRLVDYLQVSNLDPDTDLLYYLLKIKNNFY
jgi:hypothetical protein